LGPAPNLDLDESDKTVDYREKSIHPTWTLMNLTKPLIIEKNRSIPMTYRNHTLEKSDIVPFESV